MQAVHNLALAKLKTKIAWMQLGDIRKYVARRALSEIRLPRKPKSDKHSDKHLLGSGSEATYFVELWSGLVYINILVEKR